ncbi:hypothetical protein ABZP36_010776 [Zizania latifolia]
MRRAAQPGYVYVRPFLPVVQRATPPRHGEFRSVRPGKPPGAVRQAVAARSLEPLSFITSGGGCRRRSTLSCPGWTGAGAGPCELLNCSLLHGRVTSTSVTLAPETGSPPAFFKVGARVEEAEAGPPHLGLSDPFRDRLVQARANPMQLVVSTHLGHRIGHMSRMDWFFLVLAKVLIVSAVTIHALLQIKSCR